MLLGWKAQSKLATLEKSLPQTKKACKGRMCDRKREKERLFPPGPKDIIKRVFALQGELVASKHGFQGKQCRQQKSQTKPATRSHTPMRKRHASIHFEQSKEAKSQSKDADRKRSKGQSKDASQACVERGQKVNRKMLIERGLKANRKSWNEEHLYFSNFLSK